MRPTALHLFSGLGGGALGFQRAGFCSVGAVDCNPDACADLEYLTGEEATCADIGQMRPTELRALVGERRPDVVFTSPPCKAFSRCLGRETSRTDDYLELSSLSELGVWLALEAWDEPPPLIVMENVASIMTRGREWLDAVEGMLRSYGYASVETVHDCGEIGGLAQSRQRFLLVARQVDQLPRFVVEPPTQSLRGVGEVFGELPVPLPAAPDAGPLHTVPRCWDRTWIRLALIPAGGDYRDLPESVALGCAPRSGAYGVRRWEEPSGTVLGHACHDNGGFSVADPRVTCSRREGSLGVTAWDDHTHAVIASAAPENTSLQVADPRDVDDVLDGVDTDPLDWNGRSNRLRVIISEDGCWHRPMTPLELARLQGLPAKVGGEWLDLAGDSRAGWIQRIGNAVPVQAAEAIGRQLMAALTGEGWALVPPDRNIWVDRHHA